MDSEGEFIKANFYFSTCLLINLSTFNIKRMYFESAFHVFPIHQIMQISLIFMFFIH
jgi:hypothetical protein